MPIPTIHRKHTSLLTGRKDEVKTYLETASKIDIVDALDTTRKIAKKSGKPAFCAIHLNAL